jgi:TPR repeat protein
MDGHADAQYALAVMLQTGKGQTQDLQESHLWLQKAANLGHRDAVLALDNTTKN